VVIPARAPLPAGVPNYVTARGLQLLREEWEQLELERAKVAAGGAQQLDNAGDERRRKQEFLEGRLAALAGRIGSASIVDPHGQAAGLDEVRFGATVTVRPTAKVTGARRFTIVGVDEANAATGRLAFVAPMARALLGRRVGDIVSVRRGGGDEELEILSIAYDV